MAANAIIIPFFVTQYASGDVTQIGYASALTGAIFTIISLVRSYYFRRLFERLPENWSIFDFLIHKKPKTAF
jgi:hypothetical protein